MRPQCDCILNTVGTNLAMKYLPKMESDTEKAEIILMSFLMGIVSEEFDRAAHRRIEENNALRKLFSEWLPIVKQEDLKTRMESALKKGETDWRISTLDKLNCELLELLIELHSHVETLDDENARNMERAIWEELKNYTKRRDFTIFEKSQAMLLEARKASG
jgi:hypothetical protein